MQSLTIAVNVDLGAKIRTPYEIRYADHSGIHRVVDFAWVSVLYLVLAVGLLQPGAPPLLSIRCPLSIYVYVYRATAL